MKKILLAILAAAAIAGGVFLYGCSSSAQQESPVENDFVIEDNTWSGDFAADNGEWSDGQAQESVNAQSLRDRISTVEQAAEYLDSRFPELWMSLHINNGQDNINWLRSGERILEGEEINEAGRSCVASAAAYLLGDDMEIYTVIAFWSDGMSGGPMKAINCIRTPEGYEFVDIARMMSGDEMSRCGALLPEGEVSSLEEYVRLVNSDPELAEQLYSIYIFENGAGFTFELREDGWATMLSPQVEPLYVNEENYISDEEFEQQRYGHIIPENIGRYQLSEVLGGVTMTADEAYDLVDSPPEKAKEKIKTAADVLMYMLAARIGDCGGCRCDEWDGYIWHTNLTAREVMEQRLANCGASANLANYLLEGDYDEVGIILHAYYPGNGGGHVYNYFLYEGKYYIVDLSWYIFGNYDAENDFPVMELNSMEEYGQRVHELYGGVSLVICHTSTGQHLPNIFGEDFGDSHYYVPEGSEYTVLYESGDGYLIGEMPLDRKYHDWNVFW